VVVLFILFFSRTIRRNHHVPDPLRMSKCGEIDPPIIDFGQNRIDIYRSIFPEEYTVHIFEFKIRIWEGIRFGALSKERTYLF
jgi:hypothetical protein